MSGVIEREKMHPSNTMYAGWSPALQMYIMNKMESYSFFGYSDYYEITEETYEHFCDEGFVPEPVRLLFSSDPMHRPTGEHKVFHHRFFGIE